MNKAVTLLNRWAEFDEQYPDATLEDFCRHYLIKKREQQNTKKVADGITPPQIDTFLLKLMARITNMGNIYAREALKDLPQISMEGFIYLNSIYHKGESRKTDIINYNLSELSTGIDILNKIEQAGFIMTRTDPADKRVRLVSHTPEGEKILFECYQRLYAIGSLLFDEIAEADKKLCIQLLTPVEIKHSKLALQVKQEDLEAVFTEFEPGWGECGPQHR